CMPIAAGGKLIYRSYGEVVAIHLHDSKEKENGKPLFVAGELAWKSSIMKGGLASILSSAANRQALTQWIANYKSGGIGNMLFENSAVGVLTADSTNVYAVDELALPPHPNWISPNFAPGLSVDKQLKDLIEGNVLIAWDIESGKMAWELPKREPHPDSPKPAEEDETTKEVKGTHFVGPPLPLAGKLYVLNEKAGELRLLCLEPTTGALAERPQSLGSPRNRFKDDVARRLQASHLAYAEGILVCPTNAGVVLGVDLMTQSLVWAYSYRERKAAAAPPPGPRQLAINANFDWKN